MYSHTQLVCIFAICAVVSGMAAVTNDTTTTTTTTKPTESPTTSVTTQKPSTTAEPTTTSAPVKPDKFPANVGYWNFTENDTTCMMMKAAIQISINYTQQGNQSKTAIGTIDIPKDAKVSGACVDKSVNDQALTLTWPSEDRNSIENSITFKFESKTTNTTGDFFIKDVSIKINKDANVFINVTEPNTPFEYNFGSNITGFVDVPLNKSYRCNAETKISSTLDKPFSLNMEHVQLEAFRHHLNNETQFSEEYVCDGDGMSTSSYIAGIIVAILFGILLLIGIGYGIFHFFVKPRNPESGYQNM